MTRRGYPETALQLKINTGSALINNSELGKISKEQRAGNWPVWQTSLHNPNFADYAHNCGALGIRVIDNDQLDDSLSKALNYDGPSLVEILVDVDLI